MLVRKTASETDCETTVNDDRQVICISSMMQTVHRERCRMMERRGEERRRSKGA
jgi:hypothetical protein